VKRSHELADLDEARAFWTGDQLLLTANGTMPQSCWAVDVQQNLLTVWPPEFVLARYRTASICLEVITPFNVAEYFRLESRPESVVLHHRDGRTDVSVEDLSADQVALLGVLAAGTADFDEATGVSRSMSFDEAFADALAQLPPRKPSFPDQMSTVTVTETGAWFGGVAGFHHLFVRIRRPRTGRSGTASE
jgi:hypothetical protein